MQPVFLSSSLNVFYYYHFAREAPRRFFRISSYLGPIIKTVESLFGLKHKNTPRQIKANNPLIYEVRSKDKTVVAGQGIKIIFYIKLASFGIRFSGRDFQLILSNSVIVTVFTIEICPLIENYVVFTNLSCFMFFFWSAP